MPENDTDEQQTDSDGDPDVDEQQVDADAEADADDETAVDDRGVDDRGYDPLEGREDDDRIEIVDASADDEAPEYDRFAGRENVSERERADPESAADAGPERGGEQGRPYEVNRDDRGRVVDANDDSDDGDGGDDDVLTPEAAQEQHWQSVVSAIEDGAFDDDLDELAERENDRAEGPRGSVLGAIEERRDEIEN